MPTDSQGLKKQYMEKERYLVKNKEKELYCFNFTRL